MVVKDMSGIDIAGGNILKFCVKIYFNRFGVQKGVIWLGIM